MEIIIKTLLVIIHWLCLIWQLHGVNLLFEKRTSWKNGLLHIIVPELMTVIAVKLVEMLGY